MKEAVIVSAARTPVGRMRGMFASLEAIDLGAAAIKAAVERQKLIRLVSMMLFLVTLEMIIMQTYPV